MFLCDCVRVRLCVCARVCVCGGGIDVRVCVCVCGRKPIPRLAFSLRLRFPTVHALGAAPDATAAVSCSGQWKLVSGEVHAGHVAPEPPDEGARIGAGGALSSDALVEALCDACSALLAPDTAIAAEELIREVAEHIVADRAAVAAALGLDGGRTRRHAALYDLGADPAEAVDVSGAHPEVLAALQADVARLEARMPPPNRWYMIDTTARLRPVAVGDGSTVAMHAPWQHQQEGAPPPRLFSMARLVHGVAHAYVAAEFIVTTVLVVGLTRYGMRACRRRARA